MKEKTISGMKNIIAEMEQASRQSTEALIMCEQDISRMRRQLDETNDELGQIARERDILAHENDNLQEQFAKVKQENQALSKKLNDTHNELSDIKQKVQDTNLEVNKLKNILKSEESENRQIMEQLRKANEDAENWENKARQTEAENNTLKLELITAEAEGNRLKEKVDALNREVEQLCLRKHIIRVGSNVSQWLRALADLPEDPSSIPRSHMGWLLPPVIAAPGEWLPLVASTDASTHVVHTHTRTHTK